MLNDLKIVLLAGKGARFKQNGYTLPKGLLKFNNLELAIHAANSIPECSETIFGVQIRDEKNYQIKNIIKKKFTGNADFYKFNKYTNGQATSCYELINKSELNYNNSFFLLSCDFSFSVNEKKLKEIIETKYDAIVFTYQATDINYLNESSFGWVRPNKDNLINKVSCKERIYPLENNDSVIIGAFHFLEKKMYEDYYKKLLNEKRYINNETYIDVIIEMMVEDGLKIYNYQVNSFKSFGTPEEYEYEKTRIEE
tara:strand:- start:1496 stop:2257 length:762 start_codon:yes stop_codon:yes gene_type:complete